MRLSWFVVNDLFKKCGQFMWRWYPRVNWRGRPIQISCRVRVIAQVFPFHGAELNWRERTVSLRANLHLSRADTSQLSIPRLDTNDLRPLWLSCRRAVGVPKPNEFAKCSGAHRTARDEDRFPAACRLAACRNLLENSGKTARNCRASTTPLPGMPADAANRSTPIRQQENFDKT